jgi:hypothetical protein
VFCYAPPSAERLIDIETSTYSTARKKQYIPENNVHRVLRRKGITNRQIVLSINPAPVDSHFGNFRGIFDEQLVNRYKCAGMAGLLQRWHTYLQHCGTAIGRTSTAEHYMHASTGMGFETWRRRVDLLLVRYGFSI